VACEGLCCPAAPRPAPKRLQTWWLEQALWRLPRDVFGNLVLRFLNLRDLVQLDQSCCSHQRRISYLEALHCLRSQLKAKEDISLAAVNWAVSRGVKCAHVLVRNSSFGLEQLLTCRPKVMCTVQQNTLVVVGGDSLRAVGKSRINLRALTATYKPWEDGVLCATSLVSVVQNCCNLENLCLQNGSVTKELLTTICMRCPRLHTLIAPRTCHTVSSVELGAFLQKCRNLITLGVAVNTAMNDTVQLWLAGTCYRLRTLHIYAGTSITEWGLERLVAKCSTLRTLLFHDGKDRANVMRRLVSIARAKCRMLTVSTSGVQCAAVSIRTCG
jgi:hypothetical protein